jgi:hypothetical protein
MYLISDIGTLVMHFYPISVRYTGTLEYSGSNYLVYLRLTDSRVSKRSVTSCISPPHRGGYIRVQCKCEFGYLVDLRWTNRRGSRAVTSCISTTSGRDTSCFSSATLSLPPNHNQILYRYMITPTCIRIQDKWSMCTGTSLKTDN